MREDIKKTIESILQEYDYDPTVTREDWIESIHSYFDKKHDEDIRWADFDNDARNYSAEGIRVVSVTVEAIDENGNLDLYTDFSLTPGEARSMFLGIRDRYKGSE